MPLLRCTVYGWSISIWHLLHISINHQFRSLEAHPPVMDGSVSASCMTIDRVHSKFPPKKDRSDLYFCVRTGANLFVQCDAWYAEAFTTYFDRFRSPEAHLPQSWVGQWAAPVCLQTGCTQNSQPKRPQWHVRLFGPRAQTSSSDAHCGSIYGLFWSMPVARSSSINNGWVSEHLSCMPADGMTQNFHPKRTQWPMYFCVWTETNP